MPSSRKQVILRPRDDQVERWRAQADEVGLSLNAWVCAALDDAVVQLAGVSVEVHRAETLAPAPEPAGRPRMEPCIHRIPSWSFCKVCDSSGPRAATASQ